METLMDGGVVNDADIAEIGKVGREFYHKTVRKTVRRIVYVEYLAYQDVLWEDRAVARGDNLVVELEVGMARDIVNIGYARRTATPVEVAEITTMAYAAAYPGIS